MKLRLNDKMMAVNSRSESRQAYRLYFSTFIYRHCGFGIISVISAKLSNSAVWPGLLQPLIQSGWKVSAVSNLFNRAFIVCEEMQRCFTVCFPAFWNESCVQLRDSRKLCIVVCQNRRPLEIQCNNRTRFLIFLFYSTALTAGRIYASD